MNGSRTLFFFTINFPYGEGESFINNEFPYLRAHFSKIIIITSSERISEVDPGENVEVYSLPEILKGKNRKKAVLKNIWWTTRVLLLEFMNCKSPYYFIKNLRSYNSSLINSFICADFIASLKDFNSAAVFYSFWMNNHALTLSVLKMKRKIRRFVFRVHGYDLILERWPHNYIAFQATCHHYADKIFTVSKKSLDYFIKTYKSGNKAEVSYLATSDCGINPGDNSDIITLVSVSNIIPLKRMHLIVEILMGVKKPVRWIHFGNGYLFNQISDLCKNLPANVRVEFRGQVAHNELLSFYRQNHVDFFINVSDSEGLPFSVIEAISFGIPVIATNAGGTAEAVDESSGILLDINFNPATVTSLLNSNTTLRWQGEDFRKGVRTFWEEYFSAALVYPRFIKHQLS